jgi:hypothetical protein
MATRRPTQQDRDDFRRFMTHFAQEMWGYTREIAEDIADRSLASEDHYFLIYMGGRRRCKALLPAARTGDAR